MRIAPFVLVVTLVAAACGNVAGADVATPSRIAAATDFSCVIVSDGGVACWGNRAYMGAGFTPGDAALGISPPVAVAFPDGMRFTQVSATRTPYGYVHACALASDGTAWCWGDGQVGELGNGSDCCGETPVAVAMPEAVTFTQISAGSEHTCALGEDGLAWCWGSGDHGQLGDGHPTESEWNEGTSWHIANEPAPVLMPEGVVFTLVASGAYHTCALTADGQAWCWGDDSSQMPKVRPVALAMPPATAFTDLAAGGEATCGLTGEGAVWCWAMSSGRSDASGFGVTTPEIAPLPDGVRFTRLAAGRGHICALSTEGAVWCWGAWGGYGTPGSFYGDVKFPENAATTAIDLSSPSGRRFTDIAAGSGQTCAIATDSSVWCWGENDYGQLGDGTTEPSLTPVEVPIDLAAPAPPASPGEPLVLEPVILEPFAGESFLSPPPLWSLGVEQSRRVYGMFIGAWGAAPEYWGLPDKCRRSGDEREGSPEECMYAYFARLGVSLDALSLFNDYQVTVTDVEGTAPVWVAESYDWSTFETNYDGATPNLIFTPAGILDVSGSGVGSPVAAREAFAAAFASDLDERIAAAENAAWGPGYEDIYLGPYSASFIVPLEAPVRTEDGWSIPYQVQVGSGFHCCSYPFYARMVLELSAGGSPAGVRFVDWCYVDRVPFYSAGEPLPDMTAIEELGAGLPTCEVG